MVYLRKSCSNVCCTDTTCNYFFTQKKQKQGESGSAENIAVKDGESSSSSSSHSSNPDIAGFEPAPPGMAGRFDSGTSRSISSEAAQNFSEPMTDRSDAVSELVEFARQAIAALDAELAKQIQSVLKEVCDSGAADRKEVWSRLSPSERVALKALLQPQPESVPPKEAANSEPKQLNLLPDFPPPLDSENRFSPDSENWF